MNLDIPKKALEHGIRLNDKFEFVPIEGRKRLFSLNRTELLILLNNKSHFCWKYTELHLPGLIEKIGRWRVCLIGKSEKRYFIESLDGHAFLLNGVPVLSAWPLRGDKISFDYHQLKFLAPIENDFEDLKEINLCIDEATIHSNLPILIEGETGTGKSSLAKKIHERSQRRGSFVSLNLRSFSSQLIESELFGHIKGAFTGAIKDKRGALALASEGTLFLDEIDSLNDELQTKLLLFLDNLEYRPVGGETSKKTNARMIFASGRPLESLVQKGLYRPDFYFRLSMGATIRLNSFREDSELLRKSLYQLSHKMEVTVEKELQEFYLKQKWPGNFRQLLGHLQRKKVITKGNRLTFDKYDKELCKLSTHMNLSSFEGKIPTLKEVKHFHAWQTYMKLDGNLMQTSKELDISKNTLKKMLKEKD